MMTLHHGRITSMAFLVLVMVGMMTILSLAVQGQIGSGMPPNDQGQIPVIVDGIGFSDETPIEDDVIIVSATIRNNVSMDMKNITVVFLVDSMPLGNISGLSLDVSGSKIVEIKWRAEADTHIISAVISIGGKIMTGSQFSKEIVVEPEPLGNFIIPALLLSTIFIIICITTIFPGIVDLIRGNRN